MANERDIQIFKDLISRGVDENRAKELIQKSKTQQAEPIRKTETLAQKATRQADEFIGGGTKEEISTTILPKETEAGIREDITQEETLGRTGAGLGTLIGTGKVKEEPIKERGFGEIVKDSFGNVISGVGGTIGGAIEGAEQAFTGLAKIGQKKTLDLANVIRAKLGKPPLTIEEATQAGLDPIGGLQSKIQEDLLDIGEGSLGLGFTAVFPGTTALLNTASETSGGQKVLIPLSNAISAGGEYVNKTPGLKEFRNSLPEDRRQDFDAFTAQVIMLGLAKTTKEITTKYKASKINKLNKEAEGLVEEFIKPTKETTKDITKEITPEILKRKISGTREQVGEIAKTGVKESGVEIGNFIKEGKVKGDVSIDKLVDVLAKEDAALRFEGKTLPGKESQVKFIDDTLTFLEKVQKKTGNTLDANAQITLKRAFDTVFDKTITRDKITKFQDDLQVKLADTLRSELAKNNPDFAKINSNYSFFKNLEKVMEETNRRTTGQSVGLGETVLGGQKGALGAGAGASAGFAVAGPVGAVIGGTLGAVIGGKLQSIVSNPKWKLISANKKANLAKTLSEGNPAKIETLLNSFGVTMNLDFNK